MLAAIFDLNGKAGFVHLDFFQMSVPNIVLLVLMFVVFLVALLAPFPGKAKRRSRS